MKRLVSLSNLGRKSLYRYYKIDLIQKALSNRTLKLNSPSAFNDPFEAKIPMRYDLMTQENSAKMLQEMIKKKMPHLTDSQRAALLDRLLLDSKSRTENDFQVLCERIYNEVARRARIVCFSRIHDSIPMWSYYAEGHEGICVEYDERVLKQSLGHELRVGSKQLLRFDIEYMDEFPIDIPRQTPDWINAYTRNSFGRKSSCWKHEEEVRYVSWDCEKELVILPDRCITRVIMGHRISSEMKTQVLHILNSYTNNPTLEIVRLSTKRFGLETVPME